MPLIKSINAPLNASPFSMRDIETQAKDLLLRARKQADALLQAAQQEAEVLKAAARTAGAAEGRSQGFAKGREEGFAAGRDAALAGHKAELLALIGALSGAATELDLARNHLQASALKDVLDLAIAIGERATKRMGRMDSSVAVNNTIEALKLVSHKSDLRIALHPTQKAIIAEILPRLQLQWPTLKHVELIEDDSILPGGCRVFTTQGSIDGDLNTQIDKIVADLLPQNQEVVA